MVKLGNRLKQLAAMVPPGYDQIWDCCCDHGLLGAALLHRQAAPQIHFVDVVPALMERLEQQLGRYFPQPAGSRVASRWLIHCQDVSSLPIAAMAGRQLVIIAGVGGDLMAQLVAALVHGNPHLDFDLLLCPANHPYPLRAELIRLQLALIEERLVSDNRRYYELLLLACGPGAAARGGRVSAVGDQLWRHPDQAEEAARYLHQCLQHGQRQQLSQGAKVQPMVDAYQRVRLTRRDI